MAECKHEVDKRDCADCTPRPAATGPDPSLYGPWFIAAYDGACAGCSAEFFDGDEIRSDGERGWLARCCGGDDDVVHGQLIRADQGPGHGQTLLERFAAGQLDTGRGY